MRVVRHRPELPRHATKTAKATRGKGRQLSTPDHSDTTTTVLRRGKRPAPITWADATVECSTAGGWVFTLPVTERVNACWRQYRGRTIVSARHRADKAAAPLAFRHAIPLAGDVRVTVTWYRERRAGDTDGRLKTALDLLTGHAYLDDAQVADVRIVRVDDEREPARLVVHVWPVAA